MKRNIYLVLCLVFYCFSCSTNDTNESENPETNSDPNIPEETDNTNSQTNFKLLALGDSYTIGQGVCETCSFPEQLKSELQSELGSGVTLNLNIIAQTGWPTTSLLRALDGQTLANNHDLVTLLIGVNNQFQGTTFSKFEGEFVQLVSKAISYVKGDKSNLIVLSIPDYSFTPVGSNYANASGISAEIDEYNNYIESYCRSNTIDFVDVTDISRSGLTNTSLVANDGLHLSEAAYKRVVNRLLPLALQKLRD